MGLTQNLIGKGARKRQSKGFSSQFFVRMNIFPNYFPLKTGELELFFYQVIGVSRRTPANELRANG
jgi:hypothetical protein